MNLTDSITFRVLEKYFIRHSYNVITVNYFYHGNRVLKI